ncbi:MAG: adenosine deaminase [Candidatus Marinimicrobia bacterium]|nr:adenosine deaminase [Candidatus Neomarinimicrobiota bacterium]MCF7828891.1 adenosine deaminase [Candidatus Neomarinimicrobiota bacterium]MCF7879851.1 adenosine deaminase [Candidatus Neomarinimicrobiota bacterium]
MKLSTEIFRRLPKADLHCHLDGSLRIETILDLAEKSGVELPSSDPDILRKAVSVSDENESLEQYIEKFDITLSVLQTPEALERAAFELAMDAAEENTRYLEVRYSPVLHTDRGMRETETIDAVLRGLRRAESEFDIRTGVIVCGIRSISPDVSLRLAELAVAYKGKGVLGFDLAGAEENYPAKHHREAFYLTLNNNINTTLHAGEAFGPESIHQALHYCNAHRIGHGTRLKEDGDLLNYVTDHRIPLEICLTSNVQTKSVPSFERHPIRLYYDYDVRVTINTDNRLISNTTLSREYELAHEYYGFTIEDFKEIIINGFKSAFLPYRERKNMIQEVLDELEEYK